jgi:hypothetical protein
VDSGDSLDVIEKRNLLSLPGFELRFVCRLARSLVIIIIIIIIIIGGAVLSP